MQVTAVRGLSASCEARGVQREISLFMLQHESLAPGDHVMVHMERAIQKVSPEQAEAAWALYDEILAAESSQCR
jgi:hydrogenase expression/formation protein HypC